MTTKKILCLLVLSLMTNGLAAKDKDLVWQTGKLLDAEESSRYAGGRYGSSHFRAYYVTDEIYTIDAGDAVYVVQARKRSVPRLAVNGSVQFAVEREEKYTIGPNGKPALDAQGRPIKHLEEKATLYLRDSDGRQYQTTITKKILKNPLTH
jgi:hypothetical protein